MEAAEFERRAVERLDPVMRPYGFPFDPQSGGFSLLFHCDGDDLDRIRHRWPGWFGEVAAVYAPQDVVCLDLWVQRMPHPYERVGDRWDWSFEVSPEEIARFVGVDDVERLDVLSPGDAVPWLAQLAVVLGRYLDAVDAAESARRD
jgi:hypothetical protein